MQYLYVAVALLVACGLAWMYWPRAYTTNYGVRLEGNAGYDVWGRTQAECERWCTGNPGCAGYSWAPAYGDWQRSQCQGMTAFDSEVPAEYWVTKIKNKN